MSLNTINLNFINKSNDVNNPQVVIFQKNEASEFSETAVAWKVIQNCGMGDNHPFRFPMLTYISVSDSFGNFSPQMKANPGDAFQIVLNNAGDQLVSAGYSGFATEIEMRNSLPQGSVNANIFRDGKLLAIKKNLVPGQKAVFAFHPSLYIGIASQVEEGQILNSATVAEINTQISLLGIESADIVMTGGGAGPNAQPFQFSLQNVVMS